MLILQHTIVRRTKEMLAGGLRMLLPLTLTGAGAEKKTGLHASTARFTRSLNYCKSDQRSLKWDKW